VGRSIALVLALVMGLLLAWRELRVGEPAGVDAPLTRFSAGRAMADVAQVARVPHPTGSPANHAVRDRLIERMTELGLAPRLRRDESVLQVSDRRFEGALVETLVGVAPGRDRTLPLLALMAHYDSVPGAPGAADDGAGVAAVLETVRALTAQGTPARDVAVILTDGEEAGLLGARAFFQRDPLARRIGFVLNLEARGSGGRVQMFQTGVDNGGAVELFRRTAVRPSAGSLFGEVYKRLPSDTDFTVARAAGIAGFNYAFLGRAFDYHAPTDTPANLQQGSLQDMGDQVLAAARAIAFDRTLPQRRPDAVYGVAPWGAVIDYPAPWGWLPIALAAALLALSGRAARRRGQLGLREAGRGLAGAGFLLAGGLAVLHLASAVASGGAAGAQRLLADAFRWEAAQLALAAGFLVFAAAEIARGRRWAAAALALGAGVGGSIAAGGVDLLGLGAGAAGAVLALLAGGAVARPAAWSGVLALGLLIAVAAQVALPQGAYVFAWPLLAGALAAAATRLGAELRPAPLAAATLTAGLGLAFAIVHAHLLIVATGAPETLILPLLMAALVVWPLVQPAPGAPPEELAAGVLLLTGVALVAWIRLSPPWNERQPQPGYVAYQLDQDAGRAWRVKPADLGGAWANAALRADGGRIGAFAHWAWPQAMQAAPARLAQAPRPRMAVVRDESGQVVITLATDPAVRALTLQLAPRGDVRLTRIGDAAADARLAAGRWTQIRWTGPPPGGLALTLRTSGAGGLAIRYVQAFERWPAGVAPPPPRPANVMATGRSGQMFATGTLRASW
jgi:hypothetical protein